MTINEFYQQSEINLPSRRKRTRVHNWTTPAKSISELLAERSRAGRIATLDPTQRNRAADRAACDALAEARWRAAQEFGVPYAWRPGRSFLLEDLCGFHNSPRRYREVRHRPHEFFDHPTWFRWARGHAAAAIVAQPYKPAFNLAKAEEFARENELVVHVADAFESWYYPGMCVIVVWERGGPGLGGVRSGGPWSKLEP
jgi:hypothetical protein